MAAPASIAVLAEKPSVARDIARVLGATTQREGYLHGNGYIVTWAIGHLAALAQPHEINPNWRQWRRDTLPMLPAEWPLVVYEKTQDQFETVRKILTSEKVSSIVCATDAGREGELIFRYIYEAAGCSKPVSRLWISSLTPDAIRKGLDSLKPSVDYDPLADAARGRSRADWLVGMNLSRAYSLVHNENLSVGRVQTPTLAMVVERELAIRSFVPEDYIEVLATFHPTGTAKNNTYQGTWFRDKEAPQQSMRLPSDGVEAKQIAERARTGQAAIESVESQTQRMPPPQFYDLTELQRHANRLYSFSAQKTLDIAQALYERHKLISYPRTDSRHLSNDVARTLPAIVKTVEAPYRQHLAPGTGERPLNRRFVDDTKVTDHHAIIPTTTPPGKASLSADEQKLYDLICRRLLTAWHQDHVTSVTTVITAIRSAELTDRYHTSGTAIIETGWKVLDIAPAKSAKGKKGEDSASAETLLPPGLAKDQPQDVVDVETPQKKTRPPRRFTEGTLLTAMETAGKTLDEKELSDAMKETGLGTPATRASIIEVLLKREYIVRNGKSLEATEKGIRLIEIVHPEVKSPIMTGQWEAYLNRIQRRNANLREFIHGIEDYVRDVVGKAGHAKPAVQSQPAAAQAAPKAIEAVVAPVAIRSDASVTDLLHEVFGFSTFRANQEEVCRAVIEGRDALLVMPTGSGKSLCYQLPAIARGGTTLVISPLIALMEDQVAKLKQLGLKVERIHSGRDRGASRQACIDYLNGALQFLFIAPERLRVAGFPEMLAKRKPSLIAIDEAHCISQWGHDFRPDYRMLGQYLPTLRPAPVIALTATATPVVQHDIVQQLGITQAEAFIHGFRRDNLAVEVVEVPTSRRAGVVSQLLQEDERRPAIVYAPTRAQCTSLAADLGQHFPSAAYHAGLDGERRKRVQQDFLDGRIQVMVATIAFGMGIDKPDVRTVIHTALPSSLESYYQEIGRAGRDGQPSRTVLMHSYADRHTHDFFFERDYPAVGLIDKMFERLGPAPIDKASLQRMLKWDEDSFDKGLEKLWIHGGAIVDYAENITIGQTGWRDSYIVQKEQKERQLDLILRYAESSECRMAALVRHFGDLADSRKACGICDFCAPDECTAQSFRQPTAVEKDIANKVQAALLSGGSKTTGKLHAELCPRDELSRDEFEELLGAMARAGRIRITEAVFEKDGKSIPYRKVSASRETEEVDILIREALTSVREERRKTKKTKSKKVAKVAASALQKNVPEKDEPTMEALRTWRLKEAKRLGVPAFTILHDKTLQALAAQRPQTLAELLKVPGIGLKTVEKYAAQLYRLLR